MNLDIQIGDTILTGRFKNKRVVVKEFGVDDKGQPTINGRPILKFRIENKLFIPLLHISYNKMSLLFQRQHANLIYLKK